MRTAFLVFLIFLPAAILSAGVDIPKDPDPGFMRGDRDLLGYADERGCVGIWRDLGFIGFDDKDDSSGDGGVILSFRLHFSSATDTSSPYLGHGWVCPIAESSVTPRDDGSMEALLPDGRTVVLQRARGPAGDNETPLPSFHSADNRWQGTQNGDAFTLTSDDGWKLLFDRGRIREMQIDDSRPLEWTRKGGLVTEIRLKGSTGEAPFKVTYDPDGHPEGFIRNGFDYHFKLARVPLLESQAVNNTPGIRGTAADPSVTLVELTGRGDEHYQYTIGPGLQPTLVFNFINEDDDDNDVTLAWDRATRHILAEDDWHYSITPGKKPGDPPLITRVNGEGGYEYISIDREHGTITARSLEGGGTITKLARRNGAILNAARKITKAGPDGLYQTIFQADYDEAGRVMRTFDARATDPAGSNGEPGGMDVSNLNGNDDEDPDHETGPGTAALAAVSSIVTCACGVEKSLLEDAGQSAGEFQRNGALEELATFYFTTGRPDRALALLPEVTDRDTLFYIRETANFTSHTLLLDDKLQKLGQLLPDFPEKKRFIEVMEYQCQTPENR